MKRARARFFVEGVSSKLVPAYVSYFLKQSQSTEDLYNALEYLQSLLPAQGFAAGEFSMGDIAIAPFLGRARIFLSNDLGQNRDAAVGEEVWETITTGKFVRLGRYINDLFERESFKATFDEVSPNTMEGLRISLPDRWPSARRTTSILPALCK